MALLVADRVKETASFSGTTSPITLLGAATGYQSFAVIGNGNTTYYTIAGQGNSEWEVGIGTYTSAGTTLARTTVLANSAGTQPSLLSFSAGTKDVFVTQPAEVTATTVGGGNYTGPILVNGTTAYQSGTINGGTNGLSLGPITINAAVSITVSAGSKWEVLV